MNSASSLLTQKILPTGWQLFGQELQVKYPHAPWSWILETGSLTQRLQKSCLGSFSLQLLGESNIEIPETESLLLGIPQGSLVRAREVYLSCAEVPRIYAFSLIPLITLEGGGSHLEKLGTRPLGDALFKDPKLERSPVEVIMLQQKSEYFSNPLRDYYSEHRSIWGRRSVFRTHENPLLVSEFFLPGLNQCA